MICGKLFIVGAQRANTFPDDKVYTLNRCQETVYKKMDGEYKNTEEIVRKEYDSEIVEPYEEGAAEDPGSSNRLRAWLVGFCIVSGI